jgi:hypothetical protein
MTLLRSAMDLRAESIPPTPTDPPSLPRPEAPMGRCLRSFLFRRSFALRRSRHPPCRRPAGPARRPAALRAAGLRRTQHRASPRSANGPDGRICALTGGIPAVIGPADWAEHPRQPRVGGFLALHLRKIAGGPPPAPRPAPTGALDARPIPGSAGQGSCARPAPGRAAQGRRPAPRTDDPR